jgi:hypothetical protein
MEWRLGKPQEDLEGCSRPRNRCVFGLPGNSRGNGVQGWEDGVHRGPRLNLRGRPGFLCFSECGQMHLQVWARCVWLDLLCKWIALRINYCKQVWKWRHQWGKLLGICKLCERGLCTSCRVNITSHLKIIPRQCLLHWELKNKVWDIFLLLFVK